MYISSAMSDYLQRTVLMLFRVIKVSHIADKADCVCALLRDWSVKLIGDLLHLLEALLAFKQNKYMPMSFLLAVVAIKVGIMQRAFYPRYM